MNSEKRQVKQNVKDAQAISLDLKGGDEIKQKVAYYKSILKAYEDLSIAIQAKIDSIDSTGVSDVLEKSKLVIEKIDAENTVFEKKKFFEMWLAREVEYDRKFALVTKECNEQFDEVEAKAKAIAEKDIKLKSYMTKYDAEENKTAKMRVEYYLLLKFEVSKRTKESFSSVA